MKKPLDPYDEANDTVEIIENIKKQSKYRLATMPSRVKTPHKKWLATKYKMIKDEVIRERQRRKGSRDIE